jgi:predicted nucleotide-binding protein
LRLGSDSPQTFIVHGRDREAVLELKHFVQNRLRFKEPIVLDEQRADGRTIIEKFEHYAAKADVIFVLMTPDDIGHLKHSPTAAQGRPRMNVVFEFGYFLGALRRHSGRVLVLHKGPIEMPSDASGMAFIDISNGIEAAGERIRIELGDWARGGKGG